MTASGPQYSIGCTGEVQGWTPPVRTAFVACLATLGVAPVEPFPTRRSWKTPVVLPNGKTVVTGDRETWRLPTANIAGRAEILPEPMYHAWLRGDLSIDTMNLPADVALLVAALCAHRAREAVILQTRHGSRVPLCHVLPPPDMGENRPLHCLGGWRAMTRENAALDTAARLPDPKHLRRVGPEHGDHWKKRVFALAAAGFPAHARNGLLTRDESGAFFFPETSLAHREFTLDAALDTAAMIDAENARMRSGRVTRGVTNELPLYAPGQHPFHIAYQSLHTFDQLMSVLAATPRTWILNNGTIRKTAIVREDGTDDELLQAVKHAKVKL